MSSDGKRKVGIVLHADSINMLRQRAGPTQNKARTRPGIEDLDFAAMRACNLAHDRQAYASAAATSLLELDSANERCESPFLFFPQVSPAAIPYRQFALLVWRPDRNYAHRSTRPNYA